jgi:hypothetical protein
MFFMLLQPGGVLEEVGAYTRGGAKTIVQLIDTCMMGVIQAVKGSGQYHVPPKVTTSPQPAPLQSPRH